MKKSIIFIIFITSLIFITPSALAEIHTGRDWIGIFSVIDDDDQPVGSVPFNTKYGITTPDELKLKYINCTTTPGSPIPASSCGFNAPARPGLYHFRMEANDVFTPIAISTPFWVSFSASAGPDCLGIDPAITISWPYIFGLEPAGATANLNDYFDIYKDGSPTPLNTTPLRYNTIGSGNPNTYTEITTGTHSYSVVARSCYNCTTTAGSRTAISHTTTTTPSATAPTTASWSAWIQN